MGNKFLCLTFPIPEALFSDPQMAPCSCFSNIAKEATTLALIYHSAYFILTRGNFTYFLLGSAMCMHLDGCACGILSNISGDL